MDTMSAPAGASELHERILNSLGIQIVSGDMAPGVKLRSLEIAEFYHVSRGAIREVIRVLESAHLVSVRRKRGVTVEPETNWDAYSPLVIRWRLASPKRLEFLHAVSELRLVVEPLAAQLAAHHASPAQRQAITSAAQRMAEHADAADEAPYLDADIEFHIGVLSASGNPMLHGLGPVISEVLRGRTEQALMPHRANPRALQLHLHIAQAVTLRQAEQAHDAMSRIVCEADEAVQELGTA